MQRRSFIKRSITASIALPLAQNSLSQPLNQNKEKTFNLNYAPHFGMFQHSAGLDLIDQLKYMHEQGFRSFEDNEMRNRPVEVQEKIAKKMTQLGMTMGVFVGHTIYWKEANLASGDPEYRNEFLDHIKSSVETAKRINAQWMTVVPGHMDLGLEPGYQTANLVNTLRMASEILEPHNLIMVLEPLNPWANHAGQFLSKIPQAYEICKAVDSPSCKILFDIYHQQITEGNLIPNMDKAWEEIAYFQIGDNPGRNEPGTGEINYRNVFRHIHSKGYQGLLGMEHGNSIEGKKGEGQVIKAYRFADNFI